MIVWHPAVLTFVINSPYCITFIFCHRWYLFNTQHGWTTHRSRLLVKILGISCLRQTLISPLTIISTNLKCIVIRHVLIPIVYELFVSEYPFICIVNAWLISFFFAGLKRISKSYQLLAVVERKKHNKLPIFQLQWSYRVVPSSMNNDKFFPKLTYNNSFSYINMTNETVKHVRSIIVLCSSFL